MSSMRGLVQFIADLRNARARELEEKRINKELANIRYKKKYVCKLLYIYILGWNVDFGHLEAVGLISANKYSEKQIGYLAVTLFLNEKHDLLHLVVNSIKKDLMDTNELYNCLALHAIANVGGREMGEALSADVHRLLISPASKSFVKKKAALTLLRLYRKYPGIVQNEWAERIIALMDDIDLGVTLSVTSLVLALAQDNPEAYKGSYVKAAHRLKRVVVDNEYTQDYIYYKVPCPWIQVKLLRLLQYYPPSDDVNVQNMIRESLQRIIDTASDMPKNVQQNNAQNAVLFEAINLAIHLDTETGLMTQISVRLGRFISHDHLAARSDTLEPIKKHQGTIIGSLRDRDISVRRKALDLLYSMCDPSNAVPIVSELLKYLQSADYAIREEMVLKIAILAEKYATEYQWYVDTSLRLISMAGDHVSDEVWQRVIQIVTNNEELQVYAAQTILQHVKATQCHETLVKIGGYLLGEFGHLIADNPGCSPIEQFMALQSKINGCSSSTRAIILSSYIKFVNLFPEIKPQLLQVFRAYSHTLDSELQQRACEYLALASLPSDKLLRTKHAGTSDKRTWVIGGKDANLDRKEFNLTLNTGLKRSFTNGTGTPTNGGNQTPNTASLLTPSHELAGLDLNADYSSMSATTGKKAPPPNLASAAHLSPQWQKGYNMLLLRAEGVLYEDVQVQIGLRSEYRGHMGCVILYYTNKSSSPIGSFTTTINNPSKGPLSINSSNIPEPTIEADSQTQQMIMLEASNVFTDPPTIRISYLAGALQALTLQLPVVLHKFMDPAQLSADDFFKRWKQIGGAPRESQLVFGVEKGRRIDSSRTRRLMEGFRWGVLDGVDPNTKNFVGASVLHTVQGGKFGCLLRLEPNYETNMFRLTVRATDESVPPILGKLMEERLKQGAPLDR
ncbi:adaptin N terminal region-domain-containing protein [Terfezia claveryi]|nr:adaptin N terminal region-domain-containing protein [Terfezia claveryi]